MNFKKNNSKKTTNKNYFKKGNSRKNNFSNYKQQSSLLENYKKNLISSNNLLSLQKELINVQYLRINPNFKNNEEDIINYLTKKLRVKLEKTYLPLCYKIKKSFFSLGGSFLVLSGLAYLQDISSQLPLNCFDFSIFENKSINILDMCSSPGSKTTQLQYFLEKYNIKATIYANEMEKKRIKRLINNIQKSRLDNVIFSCKNALDLHFDIEFDLILLDAPCSGNLILEKNWLEKRNKKGILQNSNIQKKLLSKANNLCKKNGYIIYSTCSMEIEENEENVVYANNSLKLSPISFLNKLSWKFPFEYRSTQIVKQIKHKELLKHSIRIHPPLSKSQGFFVTIFQKK